MTDDTTAHQDLVTALGALTDVPKAGKVAAGQRRYTFLTLPDLLGAVRPVFAAHNLAVTHHVLNHEQGMTVVTRILHTSGHVFETPPLTLRCAPHPQSIGSAITYGRRYQLAALVGLAGADDDDGQHATEHRPPALDDRPAPPARGFQQGSITAGSASPQSVKYLWTLLRSLGTDEPGIRAWVASVLSIAPEWSTKDLSQQQVSTLIDRLKARPAQPGDTTPESDADK